jgi:SPOR domain
VPPPIPRNPPQQYQPPQYQQPAPQYEEEPEFEEERPVGRPPWIQRANQREIQPPRQISREVSRQALPEPEYAPEPTSEPPHPVHPLHRYAAQPGYAAQTVADHDYPHEQPLPDEGEGHELDPSRYDEALYGQLETDQDFQRDPAYPDDPYADQDGYEDEVDEGSGRRGGFLKVAAVLALAVLGTGAAFAYHSFFTSPRSGDVPIIRADNTPTKIVPAPADAGTKVPDRMVTGDAAEKIVPREETPIDVNAGGPRVVFPSLNPNGNPPSASSVSTSAMPTVTNPNAGASNGTLPAGEPRRVRTLTVRGDQPDAAATPVTAPPASPTPQVAAKPAKGAPRNPPTSANASANTPMSLSPQSAQDQAPEPRTRVAATNPAQTAPGSDSAPAGDGRFLVSITSQPSEAEAQAAFRAMQRKYPDQLASRSPVIKRVDLPDKVVYRGMVGPFGTSDEAKQFCVDYKAAGGQCFVPKN